MMNREVSKSREELKLEMLGREMCGFFIFNNQKSRLGTQRQQPGNACSGFVRPTNLSTSPRRMCEDVVTPCVEIPLSCELIAHVKHSTVCVNPGFCIS